jgi:hypothetical protein
MISNIPIYRAKKINNDEYVEGYLISHYIFKEWIDDFWTSYGETMSNKAEVYNIDVSTLSIHFPSMIDSQGNKVFASLQEDGKGGDILQSRGYKAPCIFNKGFSIRTIVGVCNFYMLVDKLKVVGIQE